MGSSQDFGGHLTPEGGEQLRQLGKMLAAQYREALFGELEPTEIGRYCRVHSSNKHRTLMSAWSLLQGFLPDVPKHFSYASDRLDVDFERLEQRLNAQGQSLGIEMSIEEALDCDSDWAALAAFQAR